MKKIVYDNYKEFLEDDEFWKKHNTIIEYDEYYDTTGENVIARVARGYTRSLNKRDLILRWEDQTWIEQREEENKNR